MSPGVALLFLELLVAIAALNFSFCKGSSSVRCSESERKSLLEFKQDLHDPWNRLASWIDDGDCCKWHGIVCDNFTGHVLELRLGNPFNYLSDNGYETYLESQMFGKLNPSLLELKHLIHLDLSGNDFQGIQIPKYLGFMEKLRYLNISDAGFSGVVPHQLGNLSNLQHLDVSHNYGLYVEKFSWLSDISLLQYLDLSVVNLSKASGFLVDINSLPSLKVLKLSCCGLHHFPSLSFVNFSSLTNLDLSENQFGDSLIPSWVFQLRHLVFLDLNVNHFQGPIPNGLGNLTSLRYLDLSSNEFNSTIPDWFSWFSGLEYLSLSDNNLQGAISDSLGNLTCIKTLYLSFNSGLELKIPRLFEKLCNLKSVSLSAFNLSREISQVLDFFEGCVSFQLESLDLNGCQLFGRLTNKLGQFKNLHSLDLFNNDISGPIPSIIGELSFLRSLDLSFNKLEGFIPFFLGQPSSLEYLYLSNNKLNGTISELHFSNLTKLTGFDASQNSLILNVNSNWVPPFQLRTLYLSSCYLGPRFPSWLRSQKHLITLSISNTGIVDTIPKWFWKSISQYTDLDLSHNQINGEIPNFIGNHHPNFTGNHPTSWIDMSSNNLSGPLPLLAWNTSVLDLSNNALSGSLFHFICGAKNMSKSMEFLKLSENLLSGEIPDCWDLNWPNLVGLNLSHNKLTGSLPISMGSLNSLQSLNLRHNRLSGAIPTSIKNCIKLVSLDISENEFVGNIPTWIGESFKKMVILNFRSNKFHGPLPINLCRLSALQILDLAHNNLSGVIPRCIKNFNAMITMNSSADKYLYYSRGVLEDASIVMKGVTMEFNYILNLVRSIDISKNYFSGRIPLEVTNLDALQSLNLSHNSFTGKIPENIGALKSLESLDFSENQLEGEIPQSLSSLTFLSHLNLSANSLRGKIPLSTQLQSLDASCFMGNDLCGSPLPRNCTEQNVSIPEDANGDEDLHEMEVDWFHVSLALGFVVGFWLVICPLLVSRNWRYKYCHFLDHLSYRIACFVRKCC